uniref:Uncharacterized protein n=1 Tax=Gorilla gorilla gorilla TaxID=9595 RepID=G3QR85_GORGO
MVLSTSVKTKLHGFLDAEPGVVSEGPPGNWEQKPVSRHLLSVEAVLSRLLPVGFQLRKERGSQARSLPGLPLRPLGRVLLRRQLQGRIQAGGASSEKRGAVPTTQRLARRPSTPHYAPISVRVHTLTQGRQPHLDAKQDSKEHLCVFYRLPIIVLGRKKRVRNKTSFHCPARFCGLVLRPSYCWKHWSL